MEKILFNITVIAFIICTFLILYFLQKYKHKERLLKIEKGLDPDLKAVKGNSKKSYLFKIGVILIGIGVGLIIIAVLVSFHLVHENLIPLAILGISGGSSMIIANSLDNKDER